MMSSGCGGVEGSLRLPTMCSTGEFMQIVMML